MNIIKFNATYCLFALVLINVETQTFATAGGRVDMTYGRGKSMLAGFDSNRSKELIQPTPISFYSDRAKVELGK